MARALLCGPMVWVAACFSPVELPECGRVEDCPPCEGYRSCQDGYCFRLGTVGWDQALCAPAPACAATTATVADSCCAGRTMAADEDSDCTGRTVEIDDAIALSDPSAAGGDVFVVAHVAGGIRLIQIEVTTGEYTSLSLPGAPPAADLDTPIVLADGTAFVASAGGLCRVSPAGALDWACDVGGPLRLLPTIARADTLVLAGTDQELRTVTPGGALSDGAPLGATALSMAGSPAGGRVFVITAAGDLVAFELPVGGAPEEVFRHQGVFAAAPISHDGADRVLVPTTGGGVAVIRDLPSGVSANPPSAERVATSEVVTDATGRGFAVLDDRELVIFEQVGNTVERSSAVMVEGDVRLAGPPLLTAAGRVIVVGDDGAVRQLEHQGGDGLTTVWRYGGLGTDLRAVNLTGDGVLVVVSRPRTIHLLTPGLGGLEAGGWPRHRRDAGSSGGFVAPAPGT